MRRDPRHSHFFTFSYFFHIKFRGRFGDRCLMVFASFFGRCSPNVPSFIATYFLKHFLQNFICVAFLLLRRTLGDTYSTKENRMILLHAPFSENPIFMRSNSESYQNADLFPHHFSSSYIICSASISASICSSDFDGKWVRK